MAESLLEELKRTDQLPSAPGVALRIVELNQQEELDIEELAGVLAQDPALVAKVIKTANSSFFGVPREVTDIQQAIVMLGLRSVNMLALSFSLLAVGTGGAGAGFDYRRYWTQTTATALAARLLASSSLPKLRDEAFLGGILCDFGQLVLAESTPDRYGPVLEACSASGEPLHVVENRELGMTHADVARELLDSWGLPELVCRGIGGHHDPSPLRDGGGDAHSLAQLLHLASTIGELFAGGDLAPAVEALRGLGSDYFGLDRVACGELLAQVQEQVPESARALSLETEDAAALFAIRSQAMECLVEESLALNRQVHTVNSKLSELQKEKGDLEVRAKVDALTGLANRGVFDEEMERALGEAAKLGASLGLLMVDLDHYKSVNDDYGHPVGDELLREVGRALRACCEDGEIACRYGGEEFVVVVPGATAEGLAERAEQIRMRIAEIELKVPDGKLGRTASVGASLCPQVTPSHRAEALVRAADRELYRAKSEGRDRVCLTVLYG